ncbi:nucleotide exchange factor for dnak activity [Bacillus sp. OxB-1]|uniref:nucleotide exchange factor GrpE n=1 Tax=Bacillus sp. (strain OxB-1) TaxID=98228 RepID=UPI00058233A3|nr:nucleotide exchange factor GrpE [Bacillus sp. OxB-1]BAQ11498.1 nucleotide exchange factor for dnak activity [Bacillus sp. OxB-1]
MTEVEKNKDENKSQEAQLDGNESPEETKGETDAAELETEATTEAELSEESEVDRVAELTALLEEEENKRLRLLADFENFKRRASLDKEALQKYRAQELVTNLIPVLDNFERALTVEAKTEEAQSLLTGMEMVHRSLVQALETEGLAEIDAQDREFDPNFHQAIMTGNDEEKDSGIVLEVFQKGYQLKDRVLRPTMVKVNE